jgi:hypothetical protein
MGLDSCIIISESHFELPKEFFEFFTTQEIHFFQSSLLSKTSAIWSCFDKVCILFMLLQLGRN